MPESRAATAECRITTLLIDGSCGPFSALEQTHSSRRGRHRRAVLDDTCLILQAIAGQSGCIGSPGNERALVPRSFVHISVRDDDVHVRRQLREPRTMPRSTASPSVILSITPPIRSRLHVEALGTHRSHAPLLPTTSAVPIHGLYHVLLVFENKLSTIL